MRSILFDWYMCLCEKGFQALATVGLNPLCVPTMVVHVDSVLYVVIGVILL